MASTQATAGTRMAKAFGLEGDAWKRHANPWSVYTRIPIPAAMSLAVWSREWIGWWSLVPIAAVAVWTAINPRVFPVPRSLDHWASKAVLGETYWTNRKTVPIPARHQLAMKLLLGLNTLGVPFLIWGLVVLNPWLAIAGLAVHMAGKNWFLDRMVWLFEDMTRQDPAGESPGGRVEVRRATRDATTWS